LARLTKSVTGLTGRVSRQRKRNQQLKGLTENFQVPTVDFYFQLKVQQYQVQLFFLLWFLIFDFHSGF
jgi:RNase P/RNase MRP subunit p29